MKRTFERQREREKERFFAQLAVFPEFLLSTSRFIKGDFARIAENRVFFIGSPFKRDFPTRSLLFPPNISIPNTLRRNIYRTMIQNFPILVHPTVTRNQCIGGSALPGFTRGVFQKPNIEGPLARSRCEILSLFLVLPRLNIIVYEISSRARYRDTGVERSSTSFPLSLSLYLSRSVIGNLFRAFQVFPKR